ARRPVVAGGDGGGPFRASPGARRSRPAGKRGRRRGRWDPPPRRPGGTPPPQAGPRALEGGGNAVDPAVAVAATLPVVEPFMSGLGGDGFYHVHVRRTGEAGVCNGTGPAPRGASPERYVRGIPVAGPLAVSVPGSVGAWGAMHARFGQRPWASLLEAAVHYARGGVGATRAY